MVTGCSPGCSGLAIADPELASWMRHGSPSCAGNFHGTGERKMSRPGQKLPALDHDPAGCRIPMKGACDLIDHQRLVIGIVKAQIPGAEPKLGRGGGELILGVQP